MRPGILSLAATAWIAIAAPAMAVPVYVAPRLDLGPVPPATAVVAFSYDVKRVFPAVEARFEQWRPRPPQANVKQLPLLPVWNDYHMIQARQLVDFREAFRRAHLDEEPLLKHLMPKFDEVYKKQGDTPPDSHPVDALARENPRQVWCRKVTAELNAILKAYNEHGVAGLSAPHDSYELLLARWRAQRNEALRIAARKEGAHEAISFMEGETNDGGLAMLDLPPGTWYLACQAEGRSWYKAIRITNRGGHIVLTNAEATDQSLNLLGWTGQ